MSRDDRAAALEDLADAIRDLSDAIDERSRDRSISAPSMRDVLRVAGEQAIPTLITLLEAQIRALKAMQRGSRLVRRGNRAEDRIRSSIGEGRTRRPDADGMVDQLGTTIDAIQRRLGDTDEETQALLDRTRSIYEEIDRTIAPQTDDTTSQDDGFRIEIDEGDGDTTDSSEEVGGQSNTGSTKSAGDHVDVDAELRTLKDQYGTGTDPEPRESTDEAHDREQTGQPGQTDGPPGDSETGTNDKPAVDDESGTGSDSDDEGDSSDDGSNSREQPAPGRGDFDPADDDDPTDSDGSYAGEQDSAEQHSEKSTTETAEDEPDDVDQ
ncbi:hypothetical protein Halru_1563 [Halovivax ruber XH-70]|uniref:Uncharacterized protein n=1 Tax=Halovivax ruber (strain DSM 18193 / JCM 13892 / XH-70) TaxID=797302 RepID=L0I981_HALRX|nr:hypothetical protein [Halovivax ruber]AGB16170.1 hypothetical protein Halru_1563 [Halovivax ruber XH-70]